MYMRKLFLSIGVLALAWLALPALADNTPGGPGAEEGTPFFVPHWTVSAHGGLAADVGEADFGQLLSPAVQLAVGYQFSEVFGLRGTLGGLWARNRYAYPAAQYQWHFLQPTLEAEVNLTPLFLGSDPERRTRAYARLGAGAAYSWGNDEAVRANERYGIDFQKLWHDSRWHAAVSGGLGLDYFVTDRVAISAEAGATVLPDHFNSKRGRGDNRDWHFTALVGLKFALGARHGRTEPAIPPAPAPVVETRAAKPDSSFVDVPVDRISFNVNVYFIINRSDIRANQTQKLNRLILYLEQHPKAFVRLSGYADRDTGTPAINMRLSRERAAVVSQYLQDAGIQEWRIRRIARGDRVQPFDVPQDNRVCICYVYDPDHPERIENWY